jgi:DNA-binding FadR family transcriptional regulator
MVSAFGAGLVRAMSEVMAEHEVIFEALMRRDPDAAEAAMRAHVHRSAVWLHHEADLLEQSEADSRDRLPIRSIATRTSTPAF